MDAAANTTRGRLDHVEIDYGRRDRRYRRRHRIGFDFDGECRHIHEQAAADKQGRETRSADQQALLQVGKSGEFGTYQVINKGNAAAPKGTVFAYSVTAPKGFPAKQTYTLTAALAPGKFVNMTKPMSSNMVGTCSPTAP